MAGTARPGAGPLWGPRWPANGGGAFALGLADDLLRRAGGGAGLCIAGGPSAVLDPGRRGSRPGCAVYVPGAAHADAGHQRRRAGGGAGLGAGLATAPAATPVDARAGAHGDDGVCAAWLGAGGGDRHRLRRHRPPVGAMVRLEATAGGQSRGAVPGLCDPLHGGGLWSGGKRPGTGSPGFAGSRPDSWCAAAGSGTAGVAADGGAGADHGFVAGGHRHNEGNAGHASASSLRLGHPGRAHL